jgi:acyl-coenzyme A synthetase/AMP-(fatty) acid ligase
VQVPVEALLFVTDELPKTATGKIQRRFMVDAFINKPAGGLRCVCACGWVQV